MIVIMVINKGKVETLDITVFAKDRKICIVRQHFIKAIGQGVRYRKFR